MNKSTDTPVLVRLYYRVNCFESDPATTLQIPALITNLHHSLQEILVADNHTSATVLTQICQPTVVINHQSSHWNHGI